MRVRAAASAVLVGCAGLVVAAACGTQQIDADDDSSQSPQTGAGEARPDFVVGPRFPIVASSGADLIAADSSSLSYDDAADRPLAMGVRGPDGVWRSVPAPDTSYDMAALASAGTSIVLAGASCQADNCTRGSIEFHRLDRGSDQWDRIGDSVGFETGMAELVAATGRNEAAWFSTPAGAFAVTEAGTPTKVPDPPSSGRSGGFCVTGSRAISIAVSPTTSTEEPMDADEFFVSDVSALDTSDPGSGWSDRAIPDVVGLLLGAVCGPDGPIFVQGGTETAYDVSSDRWASRPASVPADVILQPTVARSAVGPGGELFVLASSGAVWRRTADGQWEPWDTAASALVSTDDAVFAATAADTTLLFAPLPA